MKKAIDRLKLAAVVVAAIAGAFIALQLFIWFMWLCYYAGIPM